MFATLKGPALYVAGFLVALVVACATVLTWHGTLTGQSWLVIVVPVLTGIVGLSAAAHASAATTNALMTPPPPGLVGPPVTPPAPVVVSPPT